MRSMRNDLHIFALYKNIFNMCVGNNIELNIQWIQWKELDKTDFISRIIDIDDWQISYSVFRCLDGI